jgi:nucleotide-binding universal stress UspA family protein
MYKRILVPTDGSDVTGKAVTSAIALARSLGAEVYTICVKEPFPYGAVAEMQPAPPQEFFDDQERTATGCVRTVEAACEAAGVACHGVTVDGIKPWESILEHARANACDLLVMGSHGRSGFSAMLLGSETRDVLAHTEIPVLVIR